MSEKSKKVETCWECRWWADDPITGHSDEAQFDPSRGQCSFPLDFILAPGECCPVFDDGEFDRVVWGLCVVVRASRENRFVTVGSAPYRKWVSVDEALAAVEAALKERGGGR